MKSKDQIILEQAYEKMIQKPLKKKKLSEAFIAKKAREFFAQKADDASKLIADCESVPEIVQYRLVWLSEGSLKYHLLRRPIPNGLMADPEEVKLSKEFEEYLNQFR